MVNELKGTARMESKPEKSRLGLTLIEVMVAITVVVVGILGAAMFRYVSALDARKADVQVGAGRVGLLILEGWKGAAGADGYNPYNIPLNKNLIGGSPDISISPKNGNGEYPVELTGVSGGTQTFYYVKLTPVEDVDGDGDITDDVGIRKLEVEVTYYGRGSANTGPTEKIIKLSDFVRTN